jgi:hypothetical protein
MLKLIELRTLLQHVELLCTRILEHHLNGQGLLDLSDEGRAARSMAQTIIDKGLGDLSEIWGNEVVLYYPDLYAGQTDLCGIYQGRDSIIDFKQSQTNQNEMSGLKIIIYRVLLTLQLMIVFMVQRLNRP